MGNKKGKDRMDYEKTLERLQGAGTRYRLELKIYHLEQELFLLYARKERTLGTLKCYERDIGEERAKQIPGETSHYLRQLFIEAGGWEQELINVDASVLKTLQQITLLESERA